MNFKESTIKTYSGLSTETKPTIAGGSDVPNGSRWRELGKDGKVKATYYYNLADDRWYEHDSKTDSDRNSEDISGNLNDILKQLKIMNLHLSILTDNDIKQTEVE